MKSKARSTALASAVRLDENDARTDGRTDIQLDTQMQLFEWRVYDNTPHFLKWQGIKKISSVSTKTYVVGYSVLKRTVQMRQWF